MDAMMPGMSDLELMREARKLWPEIIGILITGYASVELAVRAIREGAHDFLVKPFTPERLLQVINREVERQRLKKEAQRVKELEEELQGLCRVKAETERLAAVESRFKLTMIHTLRAPVAALMNSLQLIRKGYVSAEEQPAFLARAETRARELLTILDDILLLSQLKEKQRSPAGEVVSLADMLETVLAKIKPEAEEGGLTVTVDIRDRPAISGKAEHIQALWAHLLSNAIRYTPAGAKISITLQAEAQNGKIIGTVSDTGIGIAPQEIPSLYGGSLEIDSTPGHGSSIRFFLPPSVHPPGAAP